MFVIPDGRSHFYQWDIGQCLQCTDLNAGTEVHFASDRRALAEVAKTYQDGDAVMVDVPDVILQHYGDIAVYIYSKADDAEGHVAKAQFFYVKARKKPADYIYAEGAQLPTWVALDERITALEQDSSQNANTSGGLNSTARNLLIEILRNGIYNSNQSANITALRVALEESGSSDSDSGSTSIPAESVSIDGDTTVNYGDTITLTATLSPSNTTDSVVWTSSDETIATVVGSGSKGIIGTVTGIKGGTVTIRATVGGVYATHTVTIEENVALPDGYTALDYVVSNWKSSFDTGITATENTSAEYKVSFTTISATHVLADNGAYAFPTVSAGGTMRSKRGGVDYNYTTALSADTIYTITAFIDENTVTVGGVVVDANTVDGATSGTGTLIFNNYGSANSPYGSAAKYYYMKIWEGGNLVRWYVPCKNENGDIGMYDVIGKTFNVSANTDEGFEEV